MAMVEMVFLQIMAKDRKELEKSAAVIVADLHGPARRCADITGKRGHFFECRAEPTRCFGRDRQEQRRAIRHHFRTEPVIARRCLKITAIRVELVLRLGEKFRCGEFPPGIGLWVLRQIGADEEQADNIGEIVIVARLTVALKIRHDVTAMRAQGWPEYVLEF